MGTKSASLILLLPILFGGAPSGRTADQKALKVYGRLVGEWKGTGQPQRGSAKGAWTEKAGWSWKLTNENAALSLQSPTGKYLREAVLKKVLSFTEILLASGCNATSRLYASM